MKGSNFLTDAVSFARSPSPSLPNRRATMIRSTARVPNPGTRSSSSRGARLMSTGNASRRCSAIGRAACRGREYQYVMTSGVDVSLKKKTIYLSLIYTITQLKTQIHGKDNNNDHRKKRH